LNEEIRNLPARNPACCVRHLRHRGLRGGVMLHLRAGYVSKAAILTSFGAPRSEKIPSFA
jgi:hypothetical protein